jgi:translation elongation factor EF-1beta
MTINENTSQQTVNLSGISSGATNENQTLTVTATSSNPLLIPNPTVTYTSPNASGSIAFTPVAFGIGSATITVTVNDGGASNNIVSRTFNVTVNGVNQAPTLNALANVIINENAPQQTVNLSGISSGASNELQTLTVTAASSNPGLIPNPTVTYTSPNATGSIAFTPVTFGFGTATITVTVNDGGASNNLVSRAFTVTVNPVNQTPTLDPLANVTINENAGQQTVNLTGIGSGAANESQTLTVTASSSNTGLIPNPTVTYSSPNATGSIRFTPVASSFGSANITVNVNDGGTSNNIVSRTFTVTVNQVNNPPTISSFTNQIIAVNTATPVIPFTISDVETPASSLTLTGNSDDPTLVTSTNLVFGGSGGNRTVRVTPIANQTGVANITITVSDGTANTSSSFQLDVRSRPAAPTNLHVTSN